MQKEINLLPRKNLGILQQERTIIIVRAIAFLSVIILVTCFVGVFLLGKNYSIDTVNTQQNSVRARLQVLHNKTITYLTLQDRVRRIQTILKSRSLLEAKIETLQKQVPQDVLLKTLTVTTKTASLSVSSPSLSSLKSFLDNVTTLLKKKTIFSTLVIDNVNVDAKTGAYSVSVGGNLL